MVNKLRDLSEMTAFTAEALKKHTVSFIVWKRDGHLLTANPQFSRLSGYNMEDLEALSWPESFFTQESKTRIFLNMDKQDAGEHSHRQEEYFVRADGSIVPVGINVHRYTQSESNNPAYFAFIEDITEQRRIESQLMLTQTAIDHISDSSIWLNSKGGIVYVNRQASESLGYSKEELLKMSIWDIDPDYPADKYFDQWQNIKAAGWLKFESVRRTKGGKEIPVEVHSSYIQSEGQELVITFDRDITNLKRYIDTIKESEEKFRVLSELSPIAIFLYQKERLIYANPAALNFTGFSLKEITGMEFWKMVHPAYRELVKKYGLARQRGEPAPARYEIMYVNSEGESRWAEFSAGLIEYKGKPAGIVAAIDTTERKQTEIALNKAKQDAELYVDLMGHDINNMNQVAMGFLEIMQNKLVDQGQLNTDDMHLLSGALESLSSSSELIGTVRKLQKEKKGDYMSRMIDVNQMIAVVKEHFAQVPGRNVRIEFISRSSCIVKANELLKDVFVNIIGNSIKHSRGALEIFITTAQTVENGKKFCRIEIEDTGPGIPDELKSAILNQSRKDRKKLTGKGLGLYLVKTLVDDYKGRVWIEDRVPGDHSRGCRFVIILPASNGRLESATSEVKA